MLAGRVAVNGRVVRELGAKADLARDRVTFDGEPLRPPGRPLTIALHKPRGVVSTLSDPEGRPTLRDLVRGLPRLYPIGRLDLQTSGLLLLTNDGALAARLLHPSREVPRVYRAKVRGTPTAEALARLKRGVRLEDGRATLAQVRVVERLPTKSWLECTVHEGRWRLVRRILDAVGHPVEKLERVRVGPLALGTLPEGHWRELVPAEVARLREAAAITETGGAAAAPPRRAAGTRARTSPPPSGGRPRGGPRGGAPGGSAGRPKTARPRRSPPRS